MSFDDKRVRGDAAELKVMEWFIERGHPVSVPFQEARYDLVGDYNGNLLRLQVKCGYWREFDGRTDQLCVETRSDTGSGKIWYSEDEIDAFVVRVPSTDRLYLVWIEEMDGRWERTIDGWEGHGIEKKLTERFK